MTIKNIMSAKGGSAFGGKRLISFVSSLALAAFPLLAGAAVLTTPLTVGTLYPSLGGVTSVSGSCGTAGANGSVSFSLVQSSTTTQLGSGSNLSTSSSGSFTGNITLPGSFPAGSATLIATCTASGDTILSSPITFPAPTSTSVSASTSTPGIGGTVNLSGACGPSAGTGTVALTLNQSGTSTSLGSATLSSTGTFSSNNVIIPFNVGAGGGTITATCSNGTTFSIPVTISGQAVTNLGVSTSPTLGTNVGVSGVCPGSANTNGSVTFGLMRLGVVTPVSATFNATGSTGGFNANINVPVSYGPGTAHLVVTCPNGSNFTAAVNLLDPASLTVPDGGSPGGVVLDAGGVGAGQTPVGGVAAGSDPLSRTNWALIIGLSLLCAIMLAAVIPFPRSTTHKNE